MRRTRRSRQLVPQNGQMPPDETVTVEVIPALEPVALPVFALKAALAVTGEKTVDSGGSKIDVPEHLQGINIASRTGEVRISATDGRRLFAYALATEETLPKWLVQGVTLPIHRLKEQLSLIEKVGTGDTIVVWYQVGAPRVELRDTSEAMSFRTFPLGGNFPDYDPMLAAIDLGSRTTVDLENTGYLTAYLKGTADLAKLLNSSAVQIYNTGPATPTLVTFPGCPGAVLIVVPWLVKDQRLAPPSAQVLLPSIGGTVAALRANRTRVAEQLEGSPDNKALQDKIEEYDQRIKQLLERTTLGPAQIEDAQAWIKRLERRLKYAERDGKTQKAENTRARLAAANADQLKVDLAQQPTAIEATVQQLEDDVAAQRAALKGAAAKRDLARFHVAVCETLAREHGFDPARVDQVLAEQAVPVNDWYRAGLSIESAAKRCLDYQPKKQTPAVEPAAAE